MSKSEVLELEEAIKDIMEEEKEKTLKHQRGMIGSMRLGLEKGWRGDVDVGYYYRRGVVMNPPKAHYMAHIHLKAQAQSKANNKKHVKKDSNGLHSRWPKSSWASNSLFMGQGGC